MKHDIDIKITKNSEEKINEFDAQIGRAHV